MTVARIALVTAVAVLHAAPSMAQQRETESANAGARLLPPALSAVLPGAGQHVLGQQRKWVYLALEIGGWAFFLERRHAGEEYRDRYRDFAWDNARVQGSSRSDGEFDYYETLTHWARSGAFDRDATTSGVQPELDVTAYNGSVWDLAARLFLSGGVGSSESDPGYPSALAYYTQKAYGPEMLWDWTGVPAAQAEFARLVDVSDSRFRQATTVLGAVIANHLLAAVDAYVSAGGPPAARLRVVPGAFPGVTWGVELSLRPPR